MRHKKLCLYLQQVLKQRPGGTQKWPIQNMAYLLIKNNKRIIGKKIMSAGPDLEGSFRCYQYYYYVMYICLNLQLRILALTQFLEFEQSLFCLKICEWAHCIYVIMSTQAAIATGRWVVWWAVQAMQLMTAYLHPCTDFQPQERLLGSTYFDYTMSKKKEGINKVIIYINWSMLLFFFSRFFIPINFLRPPPAPAPTPNLPLFRIFIATYNKVKKSGLMTSWNTKFHSL